MCEPGLRPGFCIRSTKIQYVDVDVGVSICFGVGAGASQVSDQGSCVLKRPCDPIC